MNGGYVAADICGIPILAVRSFKRSYGGVAAKANE